MREFVIVQQLVFLFARSQVAPKKQLSVSRLELCATFCGAQLIRLLGKGLKALKYRRITLWSDLTIVLLYYTFFFARRDTRLAICGE